MQVKCLHVSGLSLASKKETTPWKGTKDRTSFAIKLLIPSQPLPCYTHLLFEMSASYMHDACLTLCWCMACLCSKRKKNAVSVFCRGWPLWAKSIKTNRGLTSDLANPWATLRRKKKQSRVLSLQSAAIYPVSLKSKQLIYLHLSGNGCSADRNLLCVCVSKCKMRNNQEKVLWDTIKRINALRLSAKKSFLYPKALTVFLDFHLNSWEKDQRWIALFSQCLWSVNSD